MALLDKLFGVTTALAEQAAATGQAAAGQAAATGEQAATGSSIVALLISLLPMVLIFLVFWLMLIRPQRKKDKQVKDMLNNLKPGDRVCTIGGIYGTIASLKDDTVTLLVGTQDTKMVVARWGIRSVEDLTIENDSEALN